MDDSPVRVLVSEIYYSLNKGFQKSTSKLNGAAPTKMPKMNTNGGASHKIQHNSIGGQGGSKPSTFGNKPFKKTSITKGPTTAFKPPKMKM